MKKFSVARVSIAFPSLILTLLLIIAVPAVAQQNRSSESDRGPASEKSQTFVAHKFEHARMISVQSNAPARIETQGVRAAIDPESGELRQPTAEEIRALDLQMPASSRSITQAQQFQLPNGAVMMLVPEELLNYSFATISDGGFAIHCVDGTPDVSAASLTNDAGEKE